MVVSFRPKIADDDLALYVCYACSAALDEVDIPPAMRQEITARILRQLTSIPPTMTRDGAFEGFLRRRIAWRAAQR